MVSAITYNQCSSILAIEPFVATADVIKAFLIEKGVLPRPEEIKAAFWSLGEALKEGHWWLPIIDWEQHHLGRWVFDKGLHRGHVEPGYLEGVWNAIHHFVDHAHEGFSLKLYGDTHHIACAHFEKKAGNGIICNKDEIDNFRKKKVRGSGFQIGAKDFVELRNKLGLMQCVGDDLDWAIANLKQTLHGETETKQRELGEMVEKAKKILSEQYGELCSGKTPQEICDILSDKQWKIREDVESAGKKHAQDLNEHFKAVAKRLGLAAPFVECHLSGDALLVEYSAASDVFDFEAITEKLISEFNCNLGKLRRDAYDRIQSGASIDDVKSEYQEKVVPLIAQLYAELEWAHPKIDGQGRIDLISLNGLLCMEGLHPCILIEPYFSTANPPDLWVDYLKQGLVRFRETKEQLASEIIQTPTSVDHAAIRFGGLV